LRSSRLVFRFRWQLFGVGKTAESVAVVGGEKFTIKNYLTLATVESGCVG